MIEFLAFFKQNKQRPDLPFKLGLCKLDES